MFLTMIGMYSLRKIFLSYVLYKTSHWNLYNRFSFFIEEDLIMNKWVYTFFICIFLVGISQLGITQNSGNILNLPGVNQPQMTPSPTSGQLPALDFSQPQPVTPTQQPVLPIHSPAQPTQPQIQIINPNQNQIQGEPLPGVWKKYNLKDVVGTMDPVGRGLIEYPENWQLTPDSFNRMVSISEDPSGMVSLKLYILSYVRYSTATDYVAAIIQMLSSTVSNLRVINKDEQNVTAPAVASYGANDTIGRYELQGNIQGTEMTFCIEAGVFSLYESNIGNAAVYWAPTSVYQQKYKDFFSRMMTYYKNSVK